MATCVKSFVSLLLLLGVLTILTVSASGEDVDVVFIVPQHLQQPGVLKIVGNNSELGNMTLIPGDIWVLTVPLTRGRRYEVIVKVRHFNPVYRSDCTCLPAAARNVSVPSTGKYHVELLTGYDCNPGICPRGSESNMFNPIRRVV